MRNQEQKQLAAAVIFAAAMGFLESAVVIYLRMLYYTYGFGFPLNKLMDPKILWVEVVREIATIVMLLAAAYLATPKFKDRFAYFLLMFAVWDIFYYVWLKIILNWPVSFQTFDVLFLIPWPWVSPVLAPMTASVTMIILALGLLKSKRNLESREWELLTAGSLLMIYTFLIDYGSLIFKRIDIDKSPGLSFNPEIQKAISEYIPTHYNWLIFIIGEVLILAAIIRFRRKIDQANHR